MGSAECSKRHQERCVTLPGDPPVGREALVTAAASVS